MKTKRVDFSSMKIFIHVSYHLKRKFSFKEREKPQTKQVLFEEK